MLAATKVKMSRSEGKRANRKTRKFHVVIVVQFNGKELTKKCDKRAKFF